MSQEAFADKCGLHHTYISEIERYRRSIALENVQYIADVLGDNERITIERGRKTIVYSYYGKV